MQSVSETWRSCVRSAFSKWSFLPVWKLTEFTKALKAQGNNLNQLTTLANMGRITAVNVQEACALYADIQRSLKTLLERTV